MYSFVTNPIPCETCRDEVITDMTEDSPLCKVEEAGTLAYAGVTRDLDEIERLFEHATACHPVRGMVVGPGGRDAIFKIDSNGFAWAFRWDGR